MGTPKNTTDNLADVGTAVHLDVAAVFLKELFKRLAHDCMEAIEEAAKRRPDLHFWVNWEEDGAMLLIKNDDKEFITRPSEGTPPTSLAKTIQRGVDYVDGLVELTKEEIEEMDGLTYDPAGADDEDEEGMA